MPYSEGLKQFGGPGSGMHKGSSEPIDPEKIVKSIHDLSYTASSPWLTTEAIYRNSNLWVTGL